MRWLDGITESIDMILSMVHEIVKDREAWSTVFHGAAESDTTEQLNNSLRPQRAHILDKEGWNLSTTRRTK